MTNLRSRHLLALCCGAWFGRIGVLGAAPPAFVNYESGHTRPLAMSTDGTHLFAVNTPDNRLAIFDVTAAGLTLRGEVPVGLEPVAVAARQTSAGATEVWVVNHLSDSVSIVTIDPIDPARSRVTGTLLVGDEPRDVVFAGPGRGRGFVTTARRGQNVPASVPPRLTDPGVGRALVWAFDADAPFADTTFDADSSPSFLTGEPLAILELFTDTPRALAVSPDGNTVYAAGFHTGNQTTILPERLVQPVLAGGLRLEPPPPAGSPYIGPCDPQGDDPGPTATYPCAGLIVRRNPATGVWEDELGQNWGQISQVTTVMFDLPDRDVFAIDPSANPPTVTTAFSGVGTVLFNMAVRPGSNALFVSNLESRNHVRFEPLIDATHGLNGHLAESRITVVTGASVNGVHLNPHIDYSVATGPPAEVAQSLAFPLDVAFSSDGATLYVAGLGSEAVGVFDAAALEAGTIDKALIPVGSGPTGLVLDEAHNRLYVMHRFDQRIGIVTDVSDPARRAMTDSVFLRHDPSLQPVKRGREFLYNAQRSGHGDAACASCHIFGDLDSLAWDLGNPFGTIEDDPNPFTGLCQLGSGGSGAFCLVDADCLAGETCASTSVGRRFHPMKGPMTTQSLRGMAAAGPMHWRGDRTGGSDPGGDPLDEVAAFGKFNPAFTGLLGATSQLSAEQMQFYTDFVLSVVYPPNPIRQLDNQPTTSQAVGETLFKDAPSLGAITCNDCHRAPLGTEGFAFPDAEPQDFKIPHLRNAYQKVGMFGFPITVGGFFEQTPFMGEQIRGFGLLHDGVAPDLTTFVSSNVFSLSPTEEAQITDFVMAWSEHTPPAVGQQVGATSLTVGDPSAIARRDLLVARAQAGECDLVVKGVLNGFQRGGLYVPSLDTVVGDLLESVPVDAAWNLAATPGQEQVWTCVPAKSGQRIGVDRDLDDVLDATEIANGTDPSDALSWPGGPGVVDIPTSSLVMKDGQTAGNPAKRSFSFSSRTRTQPAANRVVPPAVGSAGDPTLYGAVLRVFNANNSGEQVTVSLPAAHWRRVGTGWKYSDTSPGAAVSRVTVTTDSLKVKAGKGGWSYTLNEARQRRMAVRLTLGTGTDWCAEAPARTAGLPPSSDRFDKVDLFKATRNSLPPLGCQSPPGG